MKTFKVEFEMQFEDRFSDDDIEEWLQFATGYRANCADN